MSISGARVLLTGGAGFLGQHVKNRLIKHGVLEKDITIPRSKNNDLRRLEVCQEIMPNHDFVIHCAVNGYGIGHNPAHSAEIFDDNASMGINLMKAAYQAGVKKFVIIGSICEYPKNAPMPLKEQSLWDGYPEELNAPYAIAKRALIVQGEAYRKQYGFNSVHLMLSNLYGPGNSFDPTKSHVTGALIVKIVNALETNSQNIDVWGDGTPSREFLYVEDAAEAVVLATENYNETKPINIGTGKETTIKELANTICQILGYKGAINWDTSKPVGQLRQSLDITNATEFGFKAKTDLETGLKRTINHYYKIRQILSEEGDV
ncbi:MAG: GDP-fucose synthetase [Candidatus Yanofskybacteria bacterium RIFCSPHIGHO2_02_FULL_38_22b]|uniref:GDP-L-fucose synthase n=1 Tax=Candidatus Yanofskybacteria bacterium RIFCSPHIGHO2_02_FULL_38_22b TaxID=1802673 RepID=A0A1F8F3Q9_9BACT|nr:MAG: GDP-fucose synthetase [Candidatus Yanofskybacteria bacterium RIFCSPHIGHO2_01_FULL_39_44]OGN07785.1 MAG: GDP-fucose synthetase [Candidatus Yanofskybacteria bacterium RIFCSPHIGHO2_02_FULL_38_22b]OGN20668.1 MAG: GDP-fucose synthetase [Candidatus Yanofskybacteria bacterium RIFCSPLOWO2_01_FULL_39_28]